MDIYSAVYPLNCILRVLGLTPFNVVGVSGSRRLQDSKILTSYDLSIIMCLAILALLKLTLFIEYTDHSFFINVRAIEYAAIIVTNIILRLACLLKKSKYESFYKTLNKIDKNFQNINRTYSKVFWRLIYVLLITFVLLSFYYIGRCQLHIANNRSGLFSAIVGFLVTVTSGTTYLVLIIDFTSSVCIINQRFKALRVIINNLVLLEMPIVTSEIHLLNARIVSLSSIKRKLQIISKVHGLLCDSSSFLTAAFSVQLLFIFGVSFLTVTYNSYFCVLSLFNQSKGVFSGTEWNLIAFYWLMLTFLSNIALLSACNTTKHEVRKVSKPVLYFSYIFYHFQHISNLFNYHARSTLGRRDSICHGDELSETTVEY